MHFYASFFVYFTFILHTILYIFSTFFINNLDSLCLIEEYPYCSYLMYFSGKLMWSMIWTWGQLDWKMERNQRWKTHVEAGSYLEWRSEDWNLKKIHYMTMLHFGASMRDFWSLKTTKEDHHSIDRVLRPKPY